MMDVKQVHWFDHVSQPLRRSSASVLGPRYSKDLDAGVDWFSPSAQSRSTLLRWVKTDGGVLVAALACGWVVYAPLEHWSLLDTIYFMVVSATTVGYGDFVPKTTAAKLFTAATCLISITTVIAALTPLVKYLLKVQRRALRRVADHLEDWFGSVQEWCSRHQPMEDSAVQRTMRSVRKASVQLISVLDPRVDSIKKTNATVSYPREYADAMLGPITLALGGIVVGVCVNGYSLVDATYWSTITMTTIGYGDFTPQSWYGKAVAIVFLPLAVTALADAICEVSRISVCRQIRETEFNLHLDQLLLDHQASAGSADATVSEGQFVVSVLARAQLVDTATLNAIRLQYAHIVRQDFESPSDAKLLTPQVVFRELVAQGRVRFRPDEAGYARWRYMWGQRVAARLADQEAELIESTGVCSA
eukprot:7379652-Prymnesium_polylepis.3